ncbi:hypothetical protein CDL15_Pgr001765 [Punica granatum]|uniref:Uncharacterized protein n=1 Tax=Punica granatum TaxID=22663 RepID=A0A218XCF5_PUNGR|nr:hypothetical protein CDL15_Pgr001765 [Punica granatum]PKI58710.1 hypothetical protein CRG98_020866 [Punica granatum]
MSVSIEALAMAGANYLDYVTDDEHKDMETPSHLLVEEEEQEHIGEAKPRTVRDVTLSGNLRPARRSYPFGRLIGDGHCGSDEDVLVYGKRHPPTTTSAVSMSKIRNRPKSKVTGLNIVAQYGSPTALVDRKGLDTKEIEVLHNSTS